MLTIMIAKHVLCSIAVTACIMLFTLLPFLPGRYDSLAVPLSVMAQLIGIAGLLLVPVGVLWLDAGHRRSHAGKHYALGIATLIVSSVVWFVASVAAAAFGGLSFGLIALVLGSYALVRVRPKLKALEEAGPELAKRVALYLIVVPIALFALQRATVGRLVEFSRSRAIQNSERLIADIEAYRVVHGRYPSSLQSVNTDYSPGLIGIRRYCYEPHGDAYNLFFEQFAIPLDAREFVVYNPRDQQVVTSHDMDLLLYSGQQLERRRGYYAVHEAMYPHWKYFWFD